MISQKKAAEMTRPELAAHIDHSVLRPEFTPDDIRKYVRAGVEYGCKTVCVNPWAISIAREITEGTKTGICTVCDFPFGASNFDWKCMQINRLAIQPEVDEIDVVMNYGLIRAEEWDKVYMEAAILTELCHDLKKAAKLILETDALTIPEIAMVTELSARAGADYVRTSTGFYIGDDVKGATAEGIRAMLKAGNGHVKIKASGGIRDPQKFFEMIDLGADRVGVGCLWTPAVLGDEE